MAAAGFPREGATKTPSQNTKHLQQLEHALGIFSREKRTLDAALKWWREHIIPCISDKLASVDLTDVSLVLRRPEARDQLAPESEERLGRLSAVRVDIFRHDCRDTDRLIKERDGLVSKLWEYLNAGPNRPVADLKQEAEMLLKERIMHVQAVSIEAANDSEELMKKAPKSPFLFTKLVTQGPCNDIGCFRDLHHAILELVVLDVPETTTELEMSLIRDERLSQSTVRTLGRLLRSRPPEDMQELLLPALPDGATPASQVPGTACNPDFTSVGNDRSARRQSLEISTSGSRLWASSDNGSRTTTMTDSTVDVSFLEKHEFRKAESPQITDPARSTHPLQTAHQKMTSKSKNQASAPPLALVSPSDKGMIPIPEDMRTAEAGSETPAAKFNPTAYPKDNEKPILYYSYYLKVFIKTFMNKL